MIAGLDRWVRSQVYNARGSGECREIILRHVILGGKLGPAVASIEINPDHRTETGIESLANEFTLIAMSDATGLGGPQQYCLQSFHGDSEKQSARFPFRVDGADDSGDDLEAFSEPATGKGLVTQQMRHNELILKTATMGMAGVVQTQARMLTSMYERMERMESDRIKNLDAFQEIMMASSEQRLAERKQDHREQMAKELIKKAGPLFGVIANKVSGGKLLPAPVKEGLGALFDSLKADPERMQQILAHLLPEEKALFAEFVNLSNSTETDPN